MSVPTIASTTVASPTLTSAILGATVTGSGITETGIAFSLTSINAAPVKGGTGTSFVVLSPLAASGGLFTLLTAGLLPGQSYTFNAYSINASGTSVANATVFTTPALPTFGTTGVLATAQTIYVRLRNGDRDTLLNIKSASQMAFQVLNGTYRDIYSSTVGNVSGYPLNGAVTTGIKAAADPAPGEGVSVPDDIGHIPPRQGQWFESGVLFTDSNSMQYRYFDKDIFGWSNGQTSIGPTNVVS